MRTVGKLTPEYVIKPDKTEKKREIQTEKTSPGKILEKTKRKIAIETRQSSTHALPAAKIREPPRAIFPRHIFAASVTDYSPSTKTGITREKSAKKFPLVLSKEATNTVEEEFDPFKL